MKYLNTLEYNKVLERLASHAISQAGKEKCLALLPFPNVSEAQKALDETDSALVLYLKYGAPSFMDITDVTSSAKRAANGATLSISELLAIAHLPSQKAEELWKRYSAMGCKIKTYALPLDNENGNAKPSLRDFSIEDLLFRAPLDINKQAEFDYSHS